MRNVSRPQARPRFTPGSENVFTDLGLPGSDELLVKARLAEAIDDAIARMGLTQVEAGRRMGVDQGTVSKLVNGRLEGFSQERLFRFLVELGESVEIVVGSARDHGGKGRVTVTRM